MKMTPVEVRSDYIKFLGGLDLMSPVLSIAPGNALDAVNYEPLALGGYKRIDGYERYDGRTSPSSATYYYATLTGTVSVGDTITGATSGATGYVVTVGDGDLALTKAVGTFTSGETLNVGGSPVGTLTSVPLKRGHLTGYDDAVSLAAAADAYRSDIGVVPGSGAILGVWMYKGVLYAFRNSADGAACHMHKSSAAGWTQIDLGEEIAFSNANASVAEGDVLTQSAVTATIKRVVVETGTLASGTNTGRLILTGRAGGSFVAGAATSTDGGSLTLGGAESAITLQPDGRFEFVNHNFAGSTDTFRMYGCDGANRAFEFDGTTFVPIETGMAEDKPSYIAAHKKKLFLAFRGSLQNSGDGTPYVWTVMAGAQEIGIGDEITGLLPQPGEALAIFSRNSSHQLVGSTIDDFTLSPISPETGAIARTAQNLGVAYALDDRGVIQITRTQAFGNFNHATVSRLAQPVIDEMRSKAVASTVYRDRNQYRLYCSDGTGFIMTIEGTKVVGITRLEYPVNVTCACSSEDGDGRDVVFFGADNGYVYQADRGSSFDGEDITAYLRMPFSNTRSPRYRKRYRKAIMEMSATGYSSIRFHPEFTYGDEDVGSHRLQTGEIQGAGGYWDRDNWEQFFYDARIVSSPTFPVSGTGLNVSLVFYSKSAIDLGHTLQGVVLHYSMRRLSR
jgi:hypothetical protein